MLGSTASALESHLLVAEGAALCGQLPVHDGRAADKAAIHNRLPGPLRCSTLPTWATALPNTVCLCCAWGAGDCGSRATLSRSRAGWQHSIPVHWEVDKVGMLRVGRGGGWRLGCVPRYLYACFISARARDFFCCIRRAAQISSLPDLASSAGRGGMVARAGCQLWRTCWWQVHVRSSPTRCAPHTPCSAAGCRGCLAWRHVFR